MNCTEEREAKLQSELVAMLLQSELIAILDNKLRPFEDKETYKQ